MKLRSILSIALVFSLFFSCGEDKNEDVKETKEFSYNVEQFADIKILRYKIPGWENLTLKEQKLVYYLTQAGLAGRDIMWDQNYRYNLAIRNALESIYNNYSGDKTTENWIAFEVYLKRVWFSNGIHHHYSNDKLKPAFNQAYFNELLKETNTKLDSMAYSAIFSDKDSKPKALFWFRWAALGTIITGLIVSYLQGYVHQAMILGIGSGDPKTTAIGIGMWLGIIMAYNVWFVIWPYQKKALGMVECSVEEKAFSAKKAMLFSRTNTLLSFPMLLSMVAAQNLY